MPALLAAMNGDGPFDQRLRAGLKTISPSLEQQLEYDPAQDIEAIHAWFSAIGPSALGRQRKKTALFALCAVPEGICLALRARPGAQRRAAVSPWKLLQANLRSRLHPCDGTDSWREPRHPPGLGRRRTEELIQASPARPRPREDRLADGDHSPYVYRYRRVVTELACRINRDRQRSWMRKRDQSLRDTTARRPK